MEAPHPLRAICYSAETLSLWKVFPNIYLEYSSPKDVSDVSHPFMVCSKSLALFPLECPIILLKTAINPALAFSLENWTNPAPSTSPHLPYFQAPPHFSGCPWTWSSLSKAGFSLEAPNWKQLCNCQGQGKQLCSQPLVDVHMSTAQPLLYFCRGLFYYRCITVFQGWN